MHHIIANKSISKYFTFFYLAHSYTYSGCGSILILDGNMKNRRDACYIGQRCRIYSVWWITWLNQDWLSRIPGLQKSILQSAQIPGMWPTELWGCWWWIRCTKWASTAIAPIDTICWKSYSRDDSSKEDNKEANILSGITTCIFTYRSRIIVHVRDGIFKHRPGFVNSLFPVHSPHPFQPPTSKLTTLNLIKHMKKNTKSTRFSGKGLQSLYIWMLWESVKSSLNWIVRSIRIRTYYLTICMNIINKLCVCGSIALRIYVMLWQKAYQLWARYIVILWQVCWWDAPMTVGNSHIAIVFRVCSQFAWLLCEIYQGNSSDPTWYLWN